MHRVLLAAVATAVVTLAAGVAAAPAEAQSGSSQGLSAINQSKSFDRSHDRRFRGDPGFRDSRRGDRDDRRHDRRRDRDDGDIFIGGYGSYGDWGRYNNRSFEFDSFNDWWHERPHRSYPKWVRNGDCDRMWWGGGKWRCTW